MYRFNRTEQKKKYLLRFARAFVTINWLLITCLIYDTNYLNFKEIKTVRYTSDCKNYYIHIGKEVNPHIGTKNPFS